MRFVPLLPRVMIALCSGLPLDAVPVHAGDVSWNQPSGGSFQDATNWSPPLMPPGPADTAVFDLDATYTVDFNADAETAALLVERSKATFDLGGFEYEVSSASIGGPFSDFLPHADLTVLDGRLRTSNLAIGEGSMRISTGAELVTGDLDMGMDNALLEILNGAKVSSTSALLSELEHEDSWVVIDGLGSSWAVHDFLVVGDEGGGFVTVGGGGLLSTESAVLGRTAGAGCCGSGLVEVVGPGSTWVNSGELAVGDDAAGSLIVRDSGLATTRDLFVSRDLTPQTGLEARVHVSDPGSLLRVSNSLVLGGDLGGVGGTAEPPGGIGSMSVSNGAQVAVGERLVLWDDATLDVWGGRLDVGGLATVAAPGEVLVHTSGLVGGTGTLQGSMKLGGTLDPGGAQGASGVSAYLKSVGYIFGPARQFRIEGTLTVTETATLTFDIAGPANSGSGDGYDSVSIVGETFLDGALRVSVVDGMVAQIASSDVFTILTAGGGLGGVFANVASGGQVAALGEDGVATEGFFQVFYGDGSPFDANAIVLTGFVAVPEPTTLLLVGGALVALAHSRRKTRPGDATARCCSIE